MSTVARPPSQPVKPAAHPASAPISAALRAWFAEQARELPWRKTRDAYAILVSEFMLQQTQVATVVPYFGRWMARFPSAAALAAAKEPEVLRLWEGLGYYARARHLHRAARTIVERHGGEIPADLAAIQALPGVGPYTAGAVASFAFGLRVPIVDANIARVLARLDDFRESIDSAAGLKRIWDLAAALLPPDGAETREHNAALMELGALLCRAGEPPCLLCPVKDWCAATDPAALPVKRARRRQIELAENCGWITRADEVLLEQSDGPRCRGLWRLPVLKRTPATAPLDESMYPFTHHRVTLRVFAAGAPRRLSTSLRWVGRTALKELAMTAPHRRALDRLLPRAGGFSSPPPDAR